MIEISVRKLQDHGTGKESRIPPEFCKNIETKAGDQQAFLSSPGNNWGILTKAVTTGDGEVDEKANAAMIEHFQQKFNSPMDPEKMITLFYSKRGCIISGRRGCGKMSFAKKLCQDRRRIIVYDTLGDYTQGVVTENLQEFETLWAESQRGNFRIIYRPLDPENEFDSICELVNEYRSLTFLVVHLDWYCEPSMSRPLKELIRNGCDHRIKLIATTQNPHAIDKLLTSNAGQIYQLVSLPTESNPQLSEPEGQQSNPELEAALSDDH